MGNYVKMHWVSQVSLLVFTFVIASAVIQYDGDYEENEQILRAKKLLRNIYPDVDLSTPELIEKEGYPCQIHRIITEDGFILELHRIPHGRHTNHHNSKQGYRKPVFIQHGALQSSADFIINGRNNSLAYQLVDNGYDVWLGNYRGNTYSYKHVNYTMKDRKYWDYSFHEMGIYDLRASIDYILMKTEEKDLYYVGFSWGTSMFFILTSLYPEYNGKIRLAICLTPAAFFGYWRSPLRFVAPIDIVNLLVMSASYGAIGDERVRPDKLLALVRSITPRVCQNNLIDDLVCNNLIFLMQGYDYRQRNNSNLAAVLARTPTTTSSKTLLHMQQLIMKNQFMHFNYGRRKNMELYGQPYPPSYDFSKITTKVAILWGPGDYMAAPKNVEKVAELLPNVVANHRVNDDKFNHYDFTYAMDAKSLVYDHCLKFIKHH